MVILVVAIGIVAVCALVVEIYRAQKKVFFLLEAEIAFKNTADRTSFVELAKMLKPALQSVSIKPTNSSVLIVRGRRNLIENLLQTYGGEVTHLSLSLDNKFPKQRENTFLLDISA